MLALLLLSATGLMAADAPQPSAKRVVILKFDGLPGWYVENALVERDPVTGKSKAPWIEHVFARDGVRLTNFYTRGISLSVPAWQILDTGHHTQIHGNAEYDRYTSRVFDYLNFFPFYVDYSRGKMADMPSVEVLDEAGIPMLLDRFAFHQRYQSFQLNQRGLRLRTLPKIITSRFASSKAKRLMDEWQAGFSFGQGVYEAMEQELIEKLQDPEVRYLDFFSGEFDHQAHLTNDAFSHAAVFEKADRLIGRIFGAIEKSPLAADTILAVVSDHGMNSVPGIYSQGYSLVNFFTSAEGGGHHVVTNRHILQEYKLMGLDPFVNRVVSSSDSSPFLSGQHRKYPTVLLDLDGNERASVHLRNNHLNRLHMVLLRLSRDPKRFAPLALSIIDSQRTRWTAALAELQTEIARLSKLIAANPAPTRLRSKEYTAAELKAGVFLEAKRQATRHADWVDTKTRYASYAESLGKLLRLNATQLETGAIPIEQLIPPGAMGEPNDASDLQAYAVELLPDGTFRTIDYLQALTGLTTRNTPQKEVSARPIDFIAVRESNNSQNVLLYAGKGLRARVTSMPDGRTQYQPLDGWKPGLPLRMMEDPALAVPNEAWLAEPHTDREWLQALHKTKYSNGLIGITEQFEAPLTKQRSLVQADMLILANDHWNFNVRSFNPGGNHGSFLRISTHSTLLLWGGANTKMPKGIVVEEPYDSLSFVPTILELLGMSDAKLPGVPIKLRPPVTAPADR
jgi:hypothetical protein